MSLPGEPTILPKLKSGEPFSWSLVISQYMIFLVNFTVSWLKEGDAPRQTWIYNADIAGVGRHVKCPKRHLIPIEQALGNNLPPHTTTPLYFRSFPERIVFSLLAGYYSCGYSSQPSPE